MKYCTLLQRSSVETAFVEVEARTEGQAKEIVEAACSRGEIDFPPVVDTNSYVVDVWPRSKDDKPDHTIT